MKKFISLFAIVAMLAMINSCGTASKVSTDNGKEAVKEARQFFRDKKHDGFVSTESGDQKRVFERYLKDKNTASPFVEFYVYAEGESDRIASKKADADIIAKYGEFVLPANFTERVVSEVGEIDEQALDSFYSAYKLYYNSLVKVSNLRKLILKKRVSENSYVYEIYAFETTNAHAKRVNALMEAAEVSGLAQEYAERVSDWIDNGGE